MRAVSPGLVLMPMFLALATALGGCTGRTSQPIVITTGIQTSTDTGDGSQIVPGGDSGIPDGPGSVEPSGGGGSTFQQPGGGGATGPGSGGSGSAGLTINQSQSDGTTKSVTWDGKSFLGNDKFSLSGQ